MSAAVVILLEEAPATEGTGALFQTSVYNTTQWGAHQHSSPLYRSQAPDPRLLLRRTRAYCRRHNWPVERIWTRRPGALFWPLR